MLVPRESCILTNARRWLYGSLDKLVFDSLHLIRHWQLKCISKFCAAASILFLNETSLSFIIDSSQNLLIAEEITLSIKVIKRKSNPVN